MAKQLAHTQIAIIGCSANPAPAIGTSKSTHTAIFTGSSFFGSGFFFGKAECCSNIRFIGIIVTATLLKDTEMRLQEH